MFHFCISLTFSRDLLPKTHRKTWSLSEQWCPSRLWRGWNCLLICLESGWLKTLNCAVTELVSGASHQRHFKWSSKVFTAHFLAVFTLWFKLCKKTFQNSCLAFTVLKWCYLTSHIWGGISLKKQRASVSDRRQLLWEAFGPDSVFSLHVHQLKSTSSHLCWKMSHIKVKALWQDLK